MNIKEARQLKNGDEIVIPSGRQYRLIKQGNPHDLWFWLVNRRTGKLITANGGYVKRVYLGSTNLQPSGMDFLAISRKID